jgi:hypothetical protein
VSEERRHDVGLSRRELEREVQWMMRTLPLDPRELARLMSRVVVTLIDRNNAALARRIEPQDDGKPGAP